MYCMVSVSNGGYEMHTRFVKLAFGCMCVLVATILILWLINNANDRLAQDAEMNMQNEAFWATAEDNNTTVAEEPLVAKESNVLLELEKVDAKAPRIMDTEYVCIGDICFSVPEYCVVESMNDISNQTMISILNHNGGMDERFQYVYYVLQMDNRGNNTIEIDLKSTTIAMLNLEEDICSSLESMYFEFSVSDRCIDSENVCVILEPGEVYQTGIIAVEYKSEVVADYYLMLNFKGHEVNLDNEDIYFLKLNEKSGE